MKTFTKSISIFYVMLFMQTLYAFDHQHKLWHSILQKNVYNSANGLTSSVDYKSIKKKSEDLQHYLRTLSSVTEHSFLKWSKNRQKAFLINAYNAFTIQLVLRHYPEINSIKEIGSFFSNPWKKKFFVLLNKKISLDHLEHKIIRKKGLYDDPFIHVALVCASKSCPALLNEAYTDEKIEAQLSENMKNFLSNKLYNRYNSESKVLEVSKIFYWYEDDFNKGYRGLFSLKDLFSRYAKELTRDINGQSDILEKKITISYLDYDWRLNDYPDKRAQKTQVFNDR